MPRPWLLTALLAVACAGPALGQSGKPFSVNPDVYDVISRSFGFDVAASHAADQGTIAVQEGHWRVASVDAVGKFEAHV